MRVVLTDRLSHTETFGRHLKAAMPDADFRHWPLDDPSWEYDLLVSWQLPEDLRSLPRSLKAIFCFGAGADRLVDDPRIPADMPITRLEDAGQGEQMLNYAMHVAFSWLLNDNAYHTAQRDRVWLKHSDKIRNREEMRVTVLGLGPLGRRVASGLADAKFQTAAWSHSRRDVSDVRTYAGWEELVASTRDADLLVNLLPLLPETRGILSDRLFSALNPGSYIVNLGRGDHLNEGDLLQALDAGRVDCAWLDVFSQEPLPSDHPFWSHEGIRMTPHMAAIPTPAGTATSIARVVDAIRRGLPLPNIVARPSTAGNLDLLKK